MDAQTYAKEYLIELKKSIDALPMDLIEQIINILFEARNNDKKIFVMGNGGSAATASHMVCDLGKGCIVSVRFIRRVKAVGGFPFVGHAISIRIKIRRPFNDGIVL